MLNTTNELGALHDMEQKTIDGIDQGTARDAWAKLKQNTRSVDQTLMHAKNTFYCVKDISDTLNRPHFDISVYLPGTSNNGDEWAILVLVQENDNSFSVIQGVDPEVTTGLAAQELNALLSQIAGSVGETREEVAGTEDVIRQTRENLH